MTWNIFKYQGPLRKPVKIRKNNLFYWDSSSGTPIEKINTLFESLLHRIDDSIFDLKFKTVELDWASHQNTAI